MSAHFEQLTNNFNSDNWQNSRTSAEGRVYGPDNSKYTPFKEMQYEKKVYREFFI